MDKEREAFGDAYPEDWAKLKMRESGSPVVDHLEAMIPRRMWNVWQAACAWQRQQDAQICHVRAVDMRVHRLASKGAFDCKDAILNQGSKE